MSFKPQRIAVIGISGSGKSTFSRKLSAATGLPLYYMDQLFWGRNWAAIPEAEWLAAEQRLIDQDRWIIEGYIDEQSADRLKTADKIIYLDFSGTYCALNGLKRWWLHWKTKRPELPEGCEEKFDPRFLWVIFRRKERGDIEKTLRISNVDHKLERILNLNDLSKFLTEKF